MTVLTTERLRLRPFTANDLDALHRIYGNADVMSIRKYGTLTRQQTAMKLERIVAHWKAHGFGMWAVLEHSDDTVIGECGLRYTDDPEDDDPTEIELSYGLLPSHWGKGLATEAAQVAMDFGFGPAGIDRVIAIAQARNGSSVRVLEKLGMQLIRRWRYEDALELVKFAMTRADAEKTSIG